MQLGLPLVCTLVLAGCASASPIPPVGVFSDQVLDPLSTKLANERIDAALGQVQSPTGLSAVLAFLGPKGALLGGGLDWWSQASAQERRAEIEARRLPLKKEILGLLESRVRPTSDGYAVCVEGTERRYSLAAGAFQREANGPGPCETVEVRTF